MYILKPAFLRLLQENYKNVFGIGSDFLLSVKIDLQEKLKYDYFIILDMNILKIFMNFLNVRVFISCQVLSQRYNLTHYKACPEFSGKFYDRILSFMDKLRNSSNTAMHIIILLFL